MAAYHTARVEGRMACQGRVAGGAWALDVHTVAKAGHVAEEAVDDHAP